MCILTVFCIHRVRKLGEQKKGKRIGRVFQIMQKKGLKRGPSRGKKKKGTNI